MATTTIITPPKRIQTERYTALPPAPRHSITVHLPGRTDLERFVQRDMTMLTQLKSMYPRIMIHRDIKALSGAIIQKLGVENKACHLFASAQSAAEFKAYATSPLRKEEPLKESLNEEDVSIKVFETNSRVYTVIYPASKYPIVHAFWINGGMGLSSRAAEYALKDIGSLREVTDGTPAPSTKSSEASNIVKQRIVDLLERAPAGQPRTTKVSTDDIYFYPTGMGAIYRVHQALLSHYNGSTVLYGFAFHSTIHVFQDWEGPGFKFFGKGNHEDITALEAYLADEESNGRRIQALWAEYPANPLIVVPDLTKLRELADKYKFALVIDDTIGSFCNVDLLSVADILVTSLTKSFSGYADVMAGSAVLNPSSSMYSDLKALFDRTYINEFFAGDAETLEHNSRDYMERSAQLNKNAMKLVEYLQTEINNPESSVTNVYYPTTMPSSLANYTPFMRAKTDDFTPGYGCLFSVDFTDEDAMILFWESLDVHTGPHLGAHLTLSVPYCKLLYSRTEEELKSAKEYDLKISQVRISVGLEDTEELLQVFKEAVAAKKN